MPRSSLQGDDMSLLSETWSGVYSAFRGNEFIMLTLGSVFVIFGVFVLSNVPFGLLDLTGWPPSLLKYKIQEEKPVPVNWNTYRKTLKLTCFNGVVTSSLFQLAIYPLSALRISCALPLPSFTKVLWDLAVCVVAVEILFYYMHRLFHHPKLYKLVHKIHHEWLAPVGVASIYCHPLEHAAVNLLPVLAGPILAGSHLSVAWLWFCLVVMSTTINHSGYHFPFLPSAESHDYHHAKFNQCYGVVGVLDYLHSTDAMFRSGPCYPRHTLLTGLAPAKTVYPDTASKRN